MQSAKDAGTIMLKVKRVKLQGSKPANPLQNLPDWTSQDHIGEHCIGCVPAVSVAVSAMSNKIFGGMARRGCRMCSHPRRGRWILTTSPVRGRMLLSCSGTGLVVR